MVLRSSASDLSSRSPMRPPMRLLLLAGSRRCFSHRADAQFPVAPSSSHRPWRWRLDAAFRAVRNPSSTDLSLPNPAAASTVLGQGGGGHGYSVPRRRHQMPPAQGTPSQSHRSPSASYSKRRSPWICRHRLLLAAKPKPTPSLHPFTGVSVLRPLPAVEWLTPSIPLLWAQFLGRFLVWMLKSMSEGKSETVLLWSYIYTAQIPSCAIYPRSPWRI
ncbi:unnamed protein product [Urochloa humidicola]